MTEQTHKRQLSAIMFSDIVGYSKKMQANEDLMLELLDRHNRIVRKQIHVNQGVEVKVIGDAFLVKFDTVANAVRCAIGIQESLKEYNEGKSESEVIQLRIGVHVGDIVIQDHDVFGDGVNIAARIEPLAQPGGICISQEVYNMVRHKIDIQMVSLGAQELKNIKEKVEIYQILVGSIGNVSTAPPRKETDNRSRKLTRFGVISGILLAIAVFAWYLKPPPANTTTGKVTAVLPFRNLSENKEDEYFSDGVTEDISSQLSKIEGLSVIAYTSAIRYKESTKSNKEIADELGANLLLQGSVRRTAGKVRISVQLVEVGTNRQIWANTYDREFADIFSIQSDVATNIALKLEATLTVQERARIDRKPTDNSEAYQLFLKGNDASTSLALDNTKRAIDYYRKAIALDSNFAIAEAHLAACFSFLVGFHGYSRTYVDSAWFHIEKANRHDPESPEVVFKRGSLEYTLGNFAASISDFQRALELRPNYWQAISGLGTVYTELGKYGLATRFLKQAILLGPTKSGYSNLCLVFLELNLTGDARDWARSALDRNVGMRGRFYTILAEAAFKENHLDIAHALADSAISYCQDDPTLSSFSAMTYLICGDTTKSFSILSELVAQDSNAITLRPVNNTTYLALIELRRGKTIQAKRLLNNTRRRDIADFDSSPKNIAYDLAAVSFLDGDTEGGYNWLRSSVEKGYCDYAFTSLDPVFHSVRDTPAFKELIATMKLKSESYVKDIRANDSEP